MIDIEYATPRWIIDQWGPWDLDVAARAWSAAAPRWYGPGSPYGADGLVEPWTGSVWCNPPYGRGLTGRWVDRAIEQMVVADDIGILLPASTDTRWWARIWAASYHVVFFSGRLRWMQPPRPDGGGRFPSALLLLSRRVIRREVTCELYPAAEGRESYSPFDGE